MSLDPRAVIEKLVSLKAVTINDLGAAVLQTEKADAFIQVVSDSSEILTLSRSVPMAASERDIDRIEFPGEVLHVPDEALTTDEPTIGTNKLTAQEIMSVVGIKDDTLEENIERAGFEDTLLNMWGKQMSPRLTRYFLQADKTNVVEPLLALTDGWIKQAGNTITGTGGTPDYDKTDPEDMFEGFLRALPKKYFSQSDMSSWRIFVSWEVMNDYWNKLKQRATNVGDQYLIGNAANLAYKAIPVRYAFGIPTGVGIFVIPNNMVWGIRRDIRIEPYRKPRARETEFIMTLRMDCTYEDENAVIVATGYTG